MSFLRIGVKYSSSVRTVLEAKISINHKGY